MDDALPRLLSDAIHAMGEHIAKTAASLGPLLRELTAWYDWIGEDPPEWDWPREGRPRPVVISSLLCFAGDQPIDWLYPAPGWRYTTPEMLERWHEDPRVPGWAP